ncbi:F-box only protein 34 [Pungitius pungitius]|uniref:F-box only protein 34 n=1 Tax=Pungitius pungitius TaxID=134920 RepID=UPI002E102DDB
MHLKSYPKLARSELRLDASSQCSLFLRTYGGSHGNIRSSRLPPGVTEEDADTPPDIWTVIRPGHVREKIAIYASDSERVSPGKVKGSWEENCSFKRRRRSGSNQKLQGTLQPSPWQPGSEALTEEQKVSVVEMVAFLEQRASEKQLDFKPLLALSRAPPPEVRGEEPESVRVSDMVAKLESESLKRRSEGDLSRSNSLRTVGRVLLAPGDQSPAPCQPSSMTSSPVAPTRHPEPAVSMQTPKEAPPPPLKEAEPLPGLLFLSPPATSQPPPHHTINYHAEPHPPRPSLDCGGQSEKRRRADRARDDDDEEEEEAAAGVPLTRRASQDFLSTRRRLQQLLEPRPFLAALPPHLLLAVLQLLPTQSLAALKCSCRYFCFIINSYGVRPADSLWVSDPRYRDDPCKQCKRRYGRGDVSPCRWHHKPFCQALPYGPGYWMCCHGAHRDAPGCNVGLHDNRWVPAFHRMNVPIHRSNH